MYIIVVSINSSQSTKTCDHEKADTKIALHLYYAMQEGARDMLVCIVDTGVIVDLLHKFSLDSNIWVAFGKGKHFIVVT